MSARLAIHGGPPVRRDPLPYGRQELASEDLEAVTAALRSAWWTTGPRVAEFEQALADVSGAAHAVAVSSGTAALHAALFALGIGPGDEVLVPAITFAATANAALYQGATPVFADVDPATLLLDPADAARRITPRTRAIVAVDYAGQPCDYAALRKLADAHGLALVADACHALGGADAGRPVGSLADVTVFSFHPVKHVAMGEGGAAVTDDPHLAGRMRRFRNHGIATDHRQRERLGAHRYDMEELGYNYRVSDLQCALGLSQLRRLRQSLARRREIAAAYRAGLAGLPGFEPLAMRPGTEHAWHLFVVRCRAERLGGGRDEVFRALRAEGIGVNVHYLPVYLHSYYRRRFGLRPGLCPAAEAAYAEVLSLPMFAALTDADAADVLAAAGKVAAAFPGSPLTAGEAQRRCA